MAIFGPTVPREQYDLLVGELRMAQNQLAQANTRYTELVTQMIEMKRHEAGMHPPGFDPSTLDLMNSLGPQTQLAIDEESGGDPEQRVYYRNVAIKETLARADMPKDERDVVVAQILRDGDT